jgi:hypothetical protein
MQGARRFVLVVLGALLCALQALAQSASPSYRLTQSTVNGGGRESSSASRRAHDSAGQESSVGTSSSPHFVLQSGFWSFVGTGLVPVVLHVNRNVVVRTTPDLSWTGNNPPYAVYRTSGCSGVFSGFLSSEPTSDYTDGSSLASGLSCYNVLATAPGPVPPSLRKETSP